MDSSEVKQAKDFVLLCSIEKMTEAKLYLLMEQFKNPEAIMSAPFNELSDIVGPEIAHRICELKPDEETKRRWESIERYQIKVIPYYDEHYPRWLMDIPNFPPVLFVRGNIQSGDEIAIAIVGTRGATVYGKSIAEDFAGKFAQAGVCVVSGMARGIDTSAHWGAIKNGGRTIAVLGCGVDIVYPPENHALMEEIVKCGAVISEFNIQTPPLAQNFPKRNRIISGLSKAVVAIEAKEKSGVMNTVEWALQQNKEIYAIPGNIYSKTSAGTNRLIKEGATPVTSAEEVLEYLGIKYTKKDREIKELILDSAERKVWEGLSHEPVYLDELKERLDMSTSEILKILLGLEIKGIVRQLPGMMFVKNLGKEPS
ncbi:MAG: DNA-processing protein DprA [candidate division WOR-3 bacterium]|nr:DNA-processing protein DprA [candidate division WOR-3 bacterium]